MRPVQAGMDPICYRSFGRSALSIVGAKIVGSLGEFGTCTVFGFLASLLPC